MAEGVATTAARQRAHVTHVRVAIVGSGFSGIGAAVRLRQAGIDDVVLFEQADAVGGTWRVNRYPGAACDVQSRLYEYSFAPNPDWSRRFAGQQEIWQYLRDCVDRFDLRACIRFDHQVRHAAWDDDAGVWRIATSHGPYTAEVLVPAVGPLSEPQLPDIPGIADFAGQVVHTSRWDESVDIRGQRVAVVGTGASAIQVVPGIQPDVAQLTLFQRTPPWVLPRLDRALTPAMGTLLRRAPALHRVTRAALYRGRELLGLPFRHPWIAPVLEALARLHLRCQIADPSLRDRVTPTYRIGCKRVLLSDDYYPALTQPNVTVVDGACARVGPRCVVGADGIEHPADVIVLATGFRATEYPFAHRVTGRNGTRLSQVWTPSMGAHVGTTVVGFPNLFVMLGPNTGLGHNSLVLMIEAQIDHLLNAIAAMDARGVDAVEPWPEAQRAWLDGVTRRMASTVWTTGGCDSWYLDATGRNTTLWPGSVGAFRRRVAPFDPTDYRMGARPRDGRTDADASRPTLVERVQGAIARAILPRLPDPVLERLGGGPVVVDGAQLDPASAVVLAARPGAGPDRLTAGTPARVRQRYRREVLAGAGRPTRVHAVRDVTVDGAVGPLRARHYLPDARGADVPTLLFLHGGGYVMGDLDTHDEPCRLLCRHARQPVLSVAYRLAPEHPYPAAVDDAVAALRWAQRHGSTLGGAEGSGGAIAVGGDSAGGAIAAAVTQRTATAAPPVAQLLIYPATDRTRVRPSQRLFDGYFLSKTDTDRFADWYYGATGTPDDDPGVSPLCAPDLSGLPPALVVTAGFDVLRDEGSAYAERLATAGVQVVHDTEPTLGHGFLHLTGVSAGARAATLSLARRWTGVLAGLRADGAAA